MSRSENFPAVDVDAAASDWLLRREAGLSDVERIEFERWMAADPRHRAAVTQADKAWRLLDRPRLAGRGHEMINALGRRATRRRRRRAAGAALALAAVVVVAFQWNPLRPPAPNVAAPVVVTPEKRVLPDGGLIEMKPGAELSVDYSGNLRRVTLRSGEALFHVAENKLRPFVVSAQGVEVRAVGTAFLVSMHTSQVDVIVTQGAVAVERPSRDSTGGEAAGEFKPTVVAAGNRVSVDLDARAAVLPAIPLSPDEIAARLEWRAPRVTFSDTALADAVAVMNRYSQIQLVIDDPVLARLPVNGVFRVDNTGTLVRVLETGFGVQAEHAGNTIILRRVR